MFEKSSTQKNVLFGAEEYMNIICLKSMTFITLSLPRDLMEKTPRKAPELQQLFGECFLMLSKL